MPKFSVGEICEAFSGPDECWVDCEIVGIGNSFGLKEIPDDPPNDYTISIQGIKNINNPHGYWLAAEYNLRKKPKQQDDKAADEDFTRDLMELLGKPAKETS